MTRKALGNGWVVYATFLLTLINVLNYMDRMALAVLLPPIKAELRLSDSQVGLLTGFAFVAIYGLVGIPLAQLADRIGRRWVLAGSIAVWSLMTSATGFAHSFLQIGLFRAGVGAGEAGCMPSSHALIADIFPQGRRVVPIAIVTAGAAIGIVLGLSLGGIIGTAYGWRTAFVVIGAPGLLVSLLVVATLPETVRQQTDGPAVSSIRSRLPALFRIQTYRWVLGAHCFYLFATSGILGWLPSFYVRSHAMNLRDIGSYFGITYGLGLAAGGLVGGLILQRLTVKSPARSLLLAGGVMLVAFPALFGALSVGNAQVSVMLMTVFGALVGCAGAPMIAGQQGVVGDNIRALASAVSMMMSSYIGGGLGPWLIGVVSQALTPWSGAGSLRASLLIASFSVLLSGLCIIKASRSFTQDCVQ